MNYDLYCEGELIGSFGDNSGLQEHYPCPSCGKVYRWKNNLQRHIKMECGKTPSFKCPHCEYYATQKSNLIRHVKNKHVLFTTNQPNINSVIKS